MVTKLFHATPQNNKESIEKSGLLPIHARGNNQVVWLADIDHLLAAIAGVSLRQHVPVSCILIFEVEQLSYFRKWSTGNWVVDKPVRVKQFFMAKSFIEGLKVAP